MSDNKFDNAISETLNGVDMPYEPSTWDALSAKLDRLAAAQPSPEAFDDRMRSALEELEMPYQPANWAKMVQKLDHIDWAKRIRKYKTAEIAVVMLLALNLQTLLDNGSRWFHMPRPEETPTEELDMAAKSRRNNNAPGGTIVKSLLAPQILPTLPMASRVESGNVQTGAYGTVNSGVSSVATAIPVVPTPTLNAALVGANGQPLPKGLKPLTLLAALGLDNIALQQPTAPMAELWEKGIIPEKNASGNTYLMVAAGAARNHFRSGNQYETRNIAPTASVHAGRRKGKWSFETGLSYAHQGYTSDTSVIGFYKKDGRILGTSYDQIQASVVSVPAKVARRIARKGKNSVHLVAGASAHFAMAKQYTYKDIEYPTGPSALPQNAPTVPNAKGVLEGGEAKANAYVTLDAGVRLEHKIHRRLAAFVEPQYRRYAGGRGFGPQKGKTSSVGVQAGVLALL